MSPPHLSSSLLCLHLIYLGKEIALRMIGDKDPAIQTQALQCISKIMVANWEFMK
jgi:hypothetical protein